LRVHQCRCLGCRFAIWPEVRRFIASLPSGAVVADVGCGNGKYFGVRPDIAVLGSDRSAGLARVAMRAAHTQHARSGGNSAADVLVADGMALPYCAGSMDAALCIAVLHHISSVARRLRFLEELRDVLRPGGVGLVTVWATQQENPAKTVAKWTPIDYSRGNFADVHSSERGEPAQGGQVDDISHGLPADFYVPWHVPFHRAGRHLSMPKVDDCSNCADASVADAKPGKSGGETASTEAQHAKSRQAAATGEVNNEKRTVVFKRYYHLFEEAELKQLIEQLSGVQLVDIKYDASNWVATFQRCT
jgi:alkylated DNA repair protein alkB homolog 8